MGGDHEYDLDEPGGSKGAPKGLAYLAPPGSDAEIAATSLSDGSKGFRYSVPTEGTAVVCTPALPLQPQMRAQGRLKVVSITPGPQPFMGLQLELRSRDRAGQLVQPPNGRYTTIRVFRDAGDWQEFDAKVVPPEGSVTGEFCFRFVRSVGSVEVDRLAIREGMGDTVDPANPAGAAAIPGDADTPPTCPAGCCPCTDASPAVAIPVRPAAVNKKGPPIFPLPIRWDLDEAGGKNGAPKGFELVADKEGGSTALSLIKSKGFSIKTTDPADNSVVCSDRFSVSGRVIVKGNLSLQDFKNGDKKNSAFIVEMRSFGADGKLVSPTKVRFQRLFIAQTVLDWMDFSKEVTPPDAAVASRICIHFADSTGQASFDWLGVYPG